MKKLDGIYGELAAVVGEENALKIAREFGGQYIYFHKLDRIERAARNEAIVREFTGSNHRALAEKYNLSTQRIRAIVASTKKTTPAQSEKKQNPMRQGNLLEL